MSQHQPRPGLVLFLCTGNYYRSRFAEELFNSFAAKAGLNWLAMSRGIATELGVLNVGPISPHALRGLFERKIAPQRAHCFPRQLQEQDLLAANLTIALKEAEHHPLLQRRFPGWVDGVVYWQVDDLDFALPDDALASLEQRVSDLIHRLSDNGSASFIESADPRP